MGRMPPALARYWAKHGRGRKVRRTVRKVAKMARRRSYRGRKRRGGRGKHGIIMGLGLIDLAQTAYTVTQIGAVEAGTQAMNGDIEGAGNTLAAKVTDPATWIGIVVGNIMLGFGGKMIRRFSPAKLKRYL